LRKRKITKQMRNMHNKFVDAEANYRFQIQNSKQNSCILQLRKRYLQQNQASEAKFALRKQLKNTIRPQNIKRIII
jgi:hypothetical protein